MGSTTYTQEREEVVDFSLTFFFSETAFLVPKNSPIKTIKDLNGKRLGLLRERPTSKPRGSSKAGEYKPKRLWSLRTCQGFLSLKTARSMPTPRIEVF